MKELFGGIFFVFIVMVVLMVGSLGLAYMGSAFHLITLPWQKFDAKVNMNSGIIKKTYNAENAIYNYHWFQERAGSIKALDGQIANADAAVVSFEAVAGAHKDWTFEDKTEDARLRAVVQGLKSERKSQIEEYNAKAGEADRSMFVDGLPLYFSL